MGDTVGEPLADGESVTDAVWLMDAVGTWDRVELGVAVGDDNCDPDIVRVCVRLGVLVDEGDLVGDRDGVPVLEGDRDSVPLSVWVGVPVRVMKINAPQVLISAKPSMHDKRCTM